MKYYNIARNYSAMTYRKKTFSEIDKKKQIERYNFNLSLLVNIIMFYRSFEKLKN